MILFIQAESRLLNPCLDQQLIDAAFADDAEAAASEWGGLFRSDISAYLPDADIDGAVVAGRKELPAINRFGYVAFCDPSGGRHDSMTLAIAHAESGDRADRLVLDNLQVAVPPFDPQEVVRRFSATVQRYGCRRLTGDKYAAEWVTTAFKHDGSMSYEPSELSKSEIYAECLPLFAQRRIELLDLPRMITEFRLLERRPRSGGRADSIDHAPRGSDDQSNAVAGALWLAATRKVPPPGNRHRPPYTIM